MVCKECWWNGGVVGEGKERENETREAAVISACDGCSGLDGPGLASSSGPAPPPGPVSGGFLCIEVMPEGIDKPLASLFVLTFIFTNSTYTQKPI